MDRHLRIKNGHKENANATDPGAGGKASLGRQVLLEGEPSGARCLGDHLVCSPCDGWAGCARLSRVPGSEVLLSLLPLTNLTLYRRARFQALFPATPSKTLR